MKMARILFSQVCKYSTGRSKLNVCVVGAGPAGFYAAMHLAKNLDNVNIDILEKLPVPYGLIRYGVAPDHPEVKNVINTFNKVAHMPNVNFYGNICLGKDISLEDLRQNYNAVILSYGAEEDKMLGIENENLPNIISARQFVGWYNGYPNNKDLKVDLSGEIAAIFGQGNVAMDVARMLLAPLHILKTTDITQHALEQLSASNIKKVMLIGRRGPLQAAFTTKELREQLKMENCRNVWRESDFDGVADVVNTITRPKKRLTELMLKSVKECSVIPKQSDTNGKIFNPIFFRSPEKFLLNEKGKLKGVVLVCNKLVGDELFTQRCVPTDEKEVLDCDVAFRSIGYKSLKVDDSINFDEKRGHVFNDCGRVFLKEKEDLGEIDHGLYVAGWLRTGPVGVIINTMGNAFQVAGSVCDDIKDNSINCNEVKGGFSEVSKVLKEKNVNFVDWNGWEKIDKYEVEIGSKIGKPREKICSVDKMLEIAL